MNISHPNTSIPPLSSHAQLSPLDKATNVMKNFALEDGFAVKIQKLGQLRTKKERILITEFLAVFMSGS